jgi:Flp pilus assembly protein protease CpaA
MQNLTIILDITRFTLLAIVIGYAAWQDHKTGEVPNKIWVYAPFGLLLTVTELWLNQNLIYPIMLSFIATVIISFALFYGGGWGGADAKAVLTIGACLPIAPFTVFNILFMYPMSVILVASILAFIAGKVKKTKTVRFLPYVFASLFIALFL